MIETEIECYFNRASSCLFDQREAYFQARGALAPYAICLCSVYWFFEASSAWCDLRNTRTPRKSKEL